MVLEEEELSWFRNLIQGAGNICCRELHSRLAEHSSSLIYLTESYTCEKDRVWIRCLVDVHWWCIEVMEGANVAARLQVAEGEEEGLGTDTCQFCWHFKSFMKERIWRLNFRRRSSKHSRGCDRGLSFRCFGEVFKHWRHSALSGVGVLQYWSIRQNWIDLKTRNDEAILMHPTGKRDKARIKLVLVPGRETTSLLQIAWTLSIPNFIINPNLEMQKGNVSFIRAATNLGLSERSWVKETHSPCVETSSSSLSETQKKTQISAYRWTFVKSSWTINCFLL